MRTTRDTVARAGAAAEYSQPSQTRQSSPVRFAQPSHRYTYSEANAPRALLTDRANAVSSREPQPGRVRVNASQAHEMDLVLPSIENSNGAHANTPASSPVSLGERSRHERRPIYVEYPADATNAYIGQYSKVVECDRQPQRRIIRSKPVTKRKSWPTQQSSGDHDRADEITIKRLRQCGHDEQQRTWYKAPIVQRSSDTLGTKQRVPHDAVPATRTPVIDLTASPYRPQSSHCDMAAYAEPFDRYRSSVTVQNSEKMHGVFAPGEPTAPQTDTHHPFSGRGTMQTFHEHFGQAPLLPHTRPGPHETAALSSHQSSVVPIVSGHRTARSDIYNSGPSVQSLARQVVVREHEQQRSVPKYISQTRYATGFPTEQQPPSQLQLSRGLPLSQTHVYRRLSPNQSYGNEPLLETGSYRATNERLPQEHQSQPASQITPWPIA